MFEGCTSLQTISFPNASFKNVTSCKSAFRELTALTSIDLSSATFEKATYLEGMFRQCTNLTTITWSQNLNLENAVRLGDTGSQDGGMFMQCSNLTNASVNILGNFAFRKVTNAANMYARCEALTLIDLHSAVFDKLTTCFSMFSGCTNLVETNMSSATFEAVNDSVLLNYALWNNCTSLTTIDVPQNSTAILPSSSADSNMNIRWSPLTNASMLKVANWLSDLTGYTAHTCTFKATAWNALTTAEQSTIDTILSGKNWTRAIA